MLDSFGREVDYLRISVTDRCNLRCRYCMPEGIEKVPMAGLLTYEELCEVAQAAVSLGITKFKVTGGEPLVRKGVPDFIRMLYAVPGVEDVTLTTNGVLLREFLPALKDAGLRSVNISLDTLDAAQYAAITGTDALRDVLLGMDAALSAGCKVKVNAVLMEGVNEEQLLPLAMLAKDNPIDVRFIELMPVGFGRQYRGISGETVLERLQAYNERKGLPPFEKDERRHGNGPAVYYKAKDGFTGSIGLISAVHGKFCASCNRLRLTSKGLLQPCLCYGTGVDLMEVFRGDEVCTGSDEGGLIADNHFSNDINKKLSDERIVLLQKKIKEAILGKPKEHRFEDVGSVNPQTLREVGG